MEKWKTEILEKIEKVKEDGGDFSLRDIINISDDYAQRVESDKNKNLSIIELIEVAVKEAKTKEEMIFGVVAIWFLSL